MKWKSSISVCAHTLHDIVKWKSSMNVCAHRRHDVVKWKSSMNAHAYTVLYTRQDILKREK